MRAKSNENADERRCRADERTPSAKGFRAGAERSHERTPCFDLRSSARHLRSSAFPKLFFPRQPPMKQFAALYAAIDSTTSTKAKTDAMAAYFAMAQPRD